MKLKASAIVISVVSVVALVAFAGTPGSTTAASARIGTEISVHPTENPGLWVGEATVSDLETGEILAQPRVQLRAGDTAELRSKGRLGEGPENEMEVLLEVSVGEAGDQAEYSSKVWVGGEVVSKQSASFRLG